MAIKNVPLVSIVIPTFNRALLLKRAVSSILKQTYQNFEVIVVDDCSSDSTELVLNNFQDKRIKYIRHEKNMGAVVARNTGIRVAKGDFIAFQDSDDEWLPDKLEKQVKAFVSASANVGVVYTSYRLIGDSEVTVYPHLGEAKTEGNIHEALLKTNFVGTPTAMVRKACFEKFGLFDNLPRLQEWALWLKISTEYDFKHVNEILVNAYVQPNSISSNLPALIKARIYLLQTYFTEISKNSSLLSFHYYQIGTFLCLNKQIREGRKYLVKAALTKPLDSTLLLSLVVSFFGQRFYGIASSIYLNSKKQ